MVEFIGFDTDTPILGVWRIHNGERWVHAFNSKEEAIKKCKLWGGLGVGYSTVDGYIYWESVVLE